MVLDDRWVVRPVEDGRKRRGCRNPALRAGPAARERRESGKEPEKEEEP